MKHAILRKRGQSILEYTVLVSLVAAALMAMNLYMQRAVKSNLTVIEDQLGRVN